MLWAAAGLSAGLLELPFPLAGPMPPPRSIEGKPQQDLAKTLPFIAPIHDRGGKATAFVCRNYACNLPTTDLKVLEEQLHM